MKIRSDKGFTLIELIVTLAVFAILVTVALPSMSGIMQRNRMSSNTNLLVGTLQFARSEAVKRSQFVTICPSDNNTNCTSSDWKTGWIVFTDRGVTGTVDVNDQILRVQSPIHQTLSLQLTATKPYIRFSALGNFAVIQAEDQRLISAINESAVSTKLAKLLFNILPIRTAHASGAEHGHDEETSDSEDHESDDSDDSDDSHASDDADDSDDAHTSDDADDSDDAHTSDDADDSDDAHASDDADDSDDTSGTAGLSGPAGAAGATDNQSTFTLCDDSRSAEMGNEIHISAVGQISLRKVSCQ